MPRAHKAAERQEKRNTVLCGHHRQVHLQRRIPSRRIRKQEVQGDGPLELGRGPAVHERRRLRQESGRDIPRNHCAHFHPRSAAVRVHHTEVKASKAPLDGREGSAYLPPRNAHRQQRRQKRCRQRKQQSFGLLKISPAKTSKLLTQSRPIKTLNIIPKGRRRKKLCHRSANPVVILDLQNLY